MKAGRSGDILPEDRVLPVQSRTIQGLLTRQLYSQMRPTLYGALAAAVILVAAMWNVVAHWKLLAWSGCFLAVHVGRHLLVRAFHRAELSVHDAIPWGRRFALATGLAAILWGSSAIVLFPADSISHQFLLMVILFFIAASSSVMHSPLTQCYTPAILVPLVGVSVRYIYEGGEVDIMIGIGALVLAAVLVGAGRVMHNTVIETLKLRYERADLIDTLMREKATVEALNEDLKAEIDRRAVMEANLTQTHDELGSRVEERTAELKAANEKLRQEITERRNAEDALRESEEHHRLLTQNSLTGIFIFQDGVLIYVNERLAEMGGYSIDDLLGKPFWEFLHPDDRETARDRGLVGTRRTPVGSQYEFRYLCKNGETRWAELLAANIQYRGRPSIMGNLADITDRKKAEEALRKSEEQYRLVVENANEAIMVAQDGRMKFVNPRVQEILKGYSQEELMSVPFIEFIHPQDRVMVAARYEGRLRNEAFPNTYAFRVMDREGGTRWVEMTSVLIDWEGMHATLNFLEDVTTRKRTEEELLRMEKLESIGILAGGIAHDFNNILTAILGNISLAKMHLTTENKIFEKLTEAEKACLSAQSLTQQLLTFSKGGVLIKRLSNISLVVESACQFALRGSNVRCHFEWPNDLWAVEVDEGQITHVMNNLIINADQAMPRGGLITVGAQNTIVPPDGTLPLQPGRYVKIHVRDQGNGIPMEHLSRIFDPYFTTKQRGSGLGLTTSYSIVKNHAGLITVESEIGSGTTFCIFLPASEEEVADQPKPKARPAMGKGRILVVDDEEPVRQIAGEMLKMLGYEVECVAEGAQGVELYRSAKQTSRPFDAVMMDLTIPGGVGGKEAFEMLREFDPEVKAVVSSGYATDPVMADYRRYGFSGVVPKPYTAEELGETLKRVLEDEDT